MAQLGKLLPNGQIQCLGRIDNQVKIRGYRIELGEIENSITQHKNIKSAVVLKQNDNLVAFIIPSNHDFDDDGELIKDLKNNLNQNLPSYFIPHDVRVLEKFPTTPNGKLDKKALLEIETLSVPSKLDNEPKCKARSKGENDGE